MGLCRRERLAISAPQANAQVALSLPILRTGWHSGESPVERLQFMLNFVTGVDDLDVDGIFGPKTEAAVRSFQQNENLSVDGIVGRRPGWRCCGVGCSSLSPASRAARQGFRASPARHRLAPRSDPITSALPVSRELRRRGIARRLAVGPRQGWGSSQIGPLRGMVRPGRSRGRTPTTWRHRRDRRRPGDAEGPRVGRDRPVPCGLRCR